MTSLKVLFDEAMHKQRSEMQCIANMNRKSRNKTGFKWLCKTRNSKYSTGHVWIYHRRVDGTHISKYAKDLFRLFDKVMELGYDWVILDEELARNTVESDGISWDEFVDYMNRNGEYKIMR